MDSKPPADFVAYAFSCRTCTYSRRLKTAYEDPTTDRGACPACGGVNWTIYGKTRVGAVVRLI